MNITVVLNQYASFIRVTSNLERREQVCLITVPAIHSHGFLSVSLFVTRRIVPLNYLINVVNFD